MGEFHDPELNLNIASVGNALRIFKSLRRVGKEASHLLLALDIKLSSRIAHAVLVGQFFAGLDTQQDVVRLGVVRISIMAVIGRDQGDSHLAAHAEQLGVHGLLVGVAVVLEFQEVVSLPKYLFVALCRLPGTRRTPADNLSRDLSGKAGGRGDNSFVELAQQIQVHTRFVVKSLCEGPADDLHQIRVSGIVLRQQNEVVIPVLPVALLTVKARTGRDIDLAADDRLDARRFRGLIKVNHAVHHAVVGNGRGCHAEFFDTADILGDLVGSVQERILRVDVQMRKGHAFSFTLVNLILKKGTSAAICGNASIPCLSRVFFNPSQFSRKASPMTRSSGVVILMLR